MSAESYQKRAPSTSSDTARLMPNIVPPQAVSDRSIIDSVAGFINDVALTNTPQTDPKDHILWVKFENLADISDSSLGEDFDVEGGLPPPLLLCIGYGSGVQVWAIPANGEAIEVMSWKNGVVKVLRVLPTPFLSNNSELASDSLDQFIHKRPLMALCGDCPSVSQSASPSQFHSANFVSLKDGDVVKSIRFKSPIVDIVANRTSIAITFAERIAVFDARTLEDRLTVTTCYPCPGGLCPIALGDRWLAYAEKKMIPSKTSAGGCFFEGVPSYTATVLNAAKSLGKGLRELGEQVAAGLTGSGTNMSGHPGVTASNVVNADGSQPGIVTILDIKHPIKDISPTTGTPVSINGNDPIIAHFFAHAEAVTAMSFDPSGMLLLTADRRGNDFNVFRIQPHPCGSTQAAVHHLYVLHRGDTSAKVQDISFSYDSRWVAVSSFRGTTHVFPITPYGGQPGFRTHSAPHVVNRLSRFHRSAGLSVDGRSSSPILMAEHAANSTAYPNPRLPPFPHPTIVLPLAQLRQPSSLGSASSSLTALATGQMLQQGSKGSSSTRQRLQSQGTEETHSKPLRVTAVFAKARSWLLDPPGLTHETPSRVHRKAVDSLFVIAGHGALIQYDLEPRHASNIAKDKVCDETPIELHVEPKAQWILGSRLNSQLELAPPLPPENWLIKDRVIDNNLNMEGQIENAVNDQRQDRWLSQVEIVTHAGPHRRLWMGPQFVFKTYNTPSGNSLALIDSESVEVGKSIKSTPMNMPLQPSTSAVPRASMPVLIESGSYSSHEQSPRLMDSFQYENTDVDIVIKPDSQLREDLADAMKDCATISVNHDSGSPSYFASSFTMSNEQRNSNASFLDKHQLSNNHVVVSVVNPQGTVTTLTNNATQPDESKQYTTEIFIHENFDETMFRPVVTVMSDPNQEGFPDYDLSSENASEVVDMPSELIVPVIDEAVLQQRRLARDIKKRESDSKEDVQKIQKVGPEALKKNTVELQTVFDVKAEVVEKPQDFQKRGKKGSKNKKFDEKKFTEMNKKKCELEKFSLPTTVKESEMQPRTLKIERESSTKEIANEIPDCSTMEKDYERNVSLDNSVRGKKASDSPKEPPVESVMPQEFSIENPTAKQNCLDVEALNDENIAVLNEALSEMKLESETAGSTTELTSVEGGKEPENPRTPEREQEKSTLSKVSPDEASWEEVKISPKKDDKRIEPFIKKGKKGRKNDSGDAKNDFVRSTKSGDDFPSLIAQNQSETIAIETTPFEEISQPQFGDDEIEIIPHENVAEDNVHSDPDANLFDESLIQSQDFSKDGQQEFIKNEDFYDIDEDLPPLEPLEQFEPFNTPSEIKSLSESVCQKQEMKQKMSELLKDTNIVFAMCSSLKEIKDDSDVMSTSSQIQRSTSSSLTTNTTTATFASANSNASLEAQDIDDSSPVEPFAATEMTTVSNMKPSVEESEETSGFETTSSETDESSKKSNRIEPPFKREDDEELRPLLGSSITSLSPSVSSSAAMNATEAIDIPTLPETNQKLSQTQPASSSNSGNKRKNKKKRK